MRAIPNCDPQHEVVSRRKVLEAVLYLAAIFAGTSHWPIYRGLSRYVEARKRRRELLRRHFALVDCRKPHVDGDAGRARYALPFRGTVS